MRLAEGMTCYERDEALCEDGMCLRCGCRLHNDRLSAQQREPVVRVKELRWYLVDNRPATRAEALSAIGLYIVADLSGDGRFAVGLDNGACAAFLLDEAGDKQLRYATFDAAKSAAQADYEQRIMAAIEIQSSDGGHGGQPSALTDAVRGASAPNAISGKQEGQTGIEVGASQTPGSSMLSGQSAPIVPEKALGPSEAIADVAAERRRQIEVEGWTPEHDDEHEHAEMACAAACYALAATPADEAIYIHGRWKDICDLFWPWSSDWWKPKDRRRDLVRAGALIVAEIERLDRLASSGRR